MLDFRIVLLSGAQVAGLILQVGILLFAYVKTGKVVPMIVAICTVVLAVLPLFVIRILDQTQYLFFITFVNLTSSVLFV